MIITFSASKMLSKMLSRFLLKSDYPGLLSRVHRYFPSPENWMWADVVHGQAFWEPSRNTDGFAYFAGSLNFLHGIACEVSVSVVESLTVLVDALIDVKFITSLLPTLNADRDHFLRVPEIILTLGTEPYFDTELEVYCRRMNAVYVRWCGFKNRLQVNLYRKWWIFSVSGQ